MGSMLSHLFLLSILYYFFCLKTNKQKLQQLCAQMETLKLDMTSDIRRLSQLEHTFAT